MKSFHASFENKIYDMIILLNRKYFTGTLLIIS